MSQTFAAAGSLVILIAWIYYAAQIFLLGAEFTKVYAQEHGSHAARHASAARKATAQAGGPVQAAPAAAPSKPAPAKPRHAAQPAVARLQQNRQKFRQADPPPKVPRTQSALAGISAAAGMVAVAVARHVRRRRRTA